MEEKTNSPVSIANGELRYNDPNFIGPPLAFNLSGARVSNGGDPNKPLYNANTDIVNIMPFALERVSHMLLANVYCPIADEVMDDYNITVKEEEKTCNAFIDTMNYFTGPNAVSTIDEAAKLSGYADRPKLEKMLMEAMLGRVMLAYYWFGIRERTEASGRPPVPPAYDRLPILQREINCALEGEETEYARKVKKKYGIKLQDNCAPINEEEEE